MIRHGFIIFLGVVLSGCVTMSRHTKAGDDLAAKTSENLATFLENEASGKPGIKPLADNQRQIAFEHARHADENPSILSPAIEAGHSSLQGFFTGGGIAGALAAGVASLMAKMKSNRIKSLVDTLAGESDVEKCKAYVEGVKV